MSRPLSRRRLLELAGVGGVAAVAAGSGGVLVARGGESSADGTAGTIPFYGHHQAGILTPQQHHLQFASYDLTAGTSPSCGICSAPGPALPRTSRAVTTLPPPVVSSRHPTTPANPVGSIRPG